MTHRQAIRHSPTSELDYRCVARPLWRPMDLTLSPEHQAFQAEVDAFLSETREEWPARGQGFRSDVALAWQR